MVTESTSIFWRNLVLVSLFLILTPLTLSLSIFSLFTLSNPQTTIQPSPKSRVQGVQVYASLPANFPAIGSEIGTADARVEIVSQYLASYRSPLVSYAQVLVDKADEYGLDFRLLPAIAQQESNLCKIIPPSSHNCWGWGIHSESNLGFDSYEESIDAVAKGLKSDYVSRGLISPEQIMTRYTPHSPEGAWAKGVLKFMAEME